MAKYWISNITIWSHCFWHWLGLISCHSIGIQTHDLTNLIASNKRKLLARKLKAIVKLKVSIAISQNGNAADRIKEIPRGHQLSGLVCAFQPGFEYQAIHRFWLLVYVHTKIYHCIEKRTKINPQRGQVWPILKSKNKSLLKKWCITTETLPWDLSLQKRTKWDFKKTSFAKCFIDYIFIDCNVASVYKGPTTASFCLFRSLQTQFYAKKL